MCIGQALGSRPGETSRVFWETDLLGGPGQSFTFPTLVSHLKPATWAPWSLKSLTFLNCSVSYGSSELHQWHLLQFVVQTGRLRTWAEGQSQPTFNCVRWALVSFDLLHRRTELFLWDFISDDKLHFAVHSYYRSQSYQGTKRLFQCTIEIK